MQGCGLGRDRDGQHHRHRSGAYAQLRTDRALRVGVHNALDTGTAVLAEAQIGEQFSQTRGAWLAYAVEQIVDFQTIGQAAERDDFQAGIEDIDQCGAGVRVIAMFQCVDQCFAQGYGRVLAGFVDTVQQGAGLVELAQHRAGECVTFANGVFAIALENGGLDNERALVGQQGGKRRFGGAGQSVVGAGVDDAAGGGIAGIGRDGCSHVGHNRAFPIPAFTGKTTLCVCESELTTIACDGLARCGVIYVALRCPHIADGTGASRRYAEVFYTPTARLT